MRPSRRASAARGERAAVRARTVRIGARAVRLVALWAFLRISTNPHASDHPLSSLEALAAVTSWLDQPVAGILDRRRASRGNSGSPARGRPGFRAARDGRGAGGHCHRARSNALHDRPRFRKVPGARLGQSARVACCGSPGPSASAAPPTALPGAAGREHQPRLLGSDGRQRALLASGFCLRL